ncbi:MAG: beta-propeller domain-containing protein [archaeon]
MDDKFILMGMDDERSKKIAEVIGNKTCKKILDYLADNTEKSEKEISEALGIPINTVEYNLKKLLDSGLVEKAKNFFWSRKGKKIDLYKLAKKHIVISPRSTRPSMTSLKAILPLIAAMAAVIIILLALWVPQDQLPIVGPTEPIEEIDNLNVFTSLAEMKKYIEDNTLSSRGYGIMEETFSAAAGAGAAKAVDSSSASEYSTTNIQVEGVDEPDIIKNDGKYIYVVSGSKVIIINAYPADDMEILSEIEFNDSAVREIFINDDKLIVFSIDYTAVPYPAERCMAIGCVVPPYYRESRTLVSIYDISDREDPELEDQVSVTGDYFDSRMIGNYVYVIANQYVSEEPVLPSVEKNGEVDIIEPTEIYYTDIKDYNFQYTIILSVNVNNGNTNEKAVLNGMTQNIYVSKDNIYTTYTQYASWYEDALNMDEESTIIHKISIDKDEINYVASGEVKGHILNQFSMDEYDENFRIATTSGSLWGREEGISKNNVYVLDEDLELIGELEDLAPGEKIFSVRFMGERGYVVTFKKVDPLFVIDLGDPEDPRVLGKLKIPGYSDYLHPYDENHIIGIGKEAVDAGEDLKDRRQLDFAWYQGVKMALFDVSDVENPAELHKVVIGDRGTDSDALYDHKAFLFDREKELLVLPILLAEIKGEKTADNQYGGYVYQGAYVYNLNLEDGFELKGRVTHYTDQEIFEKSGYYFYGDKNVQRSLYMDDVLYTFSNAMIMANDLDDLDEISSVELPAGTNVFPRYY